jgi:Nuclease-related domain
MKSEMVAKLIRLRYEGSCFLCSSALSPGTKGWWDSELRTVACVGCHSGDSGSPLEAVPPIRVNEEAPLHAPNPIAGVAGESALRMFDQRHRRRESQIERKWGKLARVVKFMSDDPQSVKAWAKGSEGERRLAADLTQRVGNRAVLLHDRKIPGSRANIDHLAIAPSGIWIIDAKNYKGKVEQRDVGGWLKTDRRLYVNGRDHTKLVGGFARQINAVLEAIGDGKVPINAALCFVGSEWNLLAKPFNQDGVWVTWPKKLSEMIAAPGSLTPSDVTQVAERLASGLPSAVPGT